MVQPSLSGRASEVLLVGFICGFASLLCFSNLICPLSPLHCCILLLFLLRVRPGTAKVFCMPDGEQELAQALSELVILVSSV